MKNPKKPDKGAGADPDPQRIAKVMARAGLCSRREAEAWITAGRVSVNGHVLETPGVTVKPGDVVLVDGQPLPSADRTRLWLFHKPRGLVTTTHDPEGRPTVFDMLPSDLPRVMTVGRLDINTEGLLLLTNDGGLARVLELPATGWLRRYRVRVHGDIDQARLDSLRDGIAVDGILYGAIEATLDRRQGDNAWLTMGLREGKNREIKNVLMHIGLDVNRLIRISFGPFQLGELGEGVVAEVPRKHLKDQLGEALAASAGADLAPREGERQPKMPKGGPAPRAEALATQPSARDAARPDAARARRRHQADIAHNAGVDTARPRPTLGLKAGRPAVDEPEAERPRGQKSRRELIDERRSGVRRAEAVVERRPKRGERPDDKAQDGRDRPGRRQTRSEGERAAGGWNPADPASRRVATAERGERRGDFRSRGMRSHGTDDADRPSRSRGTRTAEPSARPSRGRTGDAAPTPRGFDDGRRRGEGQGSRGHGADGGERGRPRDPGGREDGRPERQGRSADGRPFAPRPRASRSVGEVSSGAPGQSRAGRGETANQRDERPFRGHGSGGGGNPRASSVPDADRRRSAGAQGGGAREADARPERHERRTGGGKPGGYGAQGERASTHGGPRTARHGGTGPAGHAAKRSGPRSDAPHGGPAGGKPRGDASDRGPGGGKPRGGKPGGKPRGGPGGGGADRRR